MPCEKHSPRASVTTKTSAYGLGFCLLSPLGHVFHTAWETMIKSYNSEESYQYIFRHLRIWKWLEASHKLLNTSDKYLTKNHFVTNVHMRAYFCYKMMHCGIWDWCIMGFVQQVYWSKQFTHTTLHIPIQNSEILPSSSGGWIWKQGFWGIFQ